MQLKRLDIQERKAGGKERIIIIYKHVWMSSSIASEFVQQLQRFFIAVASVCWWPMVHNRPADINPQDRKL